MIAQADVDAWYDATYGGGDWRTHPAAGLPWVRRTVYAAHVDRLAYAQPLSEEDRERVHQALVSGGDMPFRALVQATGLDRRTTYRALQSLISRGLVLSMRVRRPGARGRKGRTMRVYVGLGWL